MHWYRTDTSYAAAFCDFYILVNQRNNCVYNGLSYTGSHVRCVTHVKQNNHYNLFCRSKHIQAYVCVYVLFYITAYKTFAKYVLRWGICKHVLKHFWNVLQGVSLAACYAMAKASVRLSVRPSVRPCCPIKKTQARITKSSQLGPYQDPQSFSRNSKGSLRSRSVNKRGVGIICVFQPITRRISETVQDTAKVTIDHFQLVPKSMSLDDLERPYRTVLQK